MEEISISNFGGGLNEAVDTSKISTNEASYLRNCDIADGSLKPSRGLLDHMTAPIAVETLMVYHNNGNKEFVIAGEGKLYLRRSGAWVLLGSGFLSDRWDFINYNYNSVDVMILVNGVDNNKILQDTTLRDMKDRRISYDVSGNVNGYYDANGVLRANEGLVTTLAPKAKFVELHYERIWLAGDQSVYFSKDFDPEDFTVPVTETEANLHGGEIVMESFDGTKIVGLKVVFDNIVILKEKSAWKIFGSYAEQYQKVQLFSSNGAIADGSFCSTPKGCFFLNYDGIYLYDGVNCDPVSEKVNRTIKTFDHTQLHKARGVSHRNKYILCVPTTTGWLTIEFDYVTAVFTLHDISATGFLELIDDLYAIKGDAKIYEYGKGAYLSAEWHTGQSDMGIPNAMKENEEVYFTGKGDAVEITLRTEKKDKTKGFILTADKRVHKRALINYGRLMQFIFKGTAGSYFEIIGFKSFMDLDRD